MLMYPSASAMSPQPSPSQHPSRKPPPPSNDPKFSLDSVRTEVPREYPKSKELNRLFGLEHCPVFYPSVDEFKEPMKYVESIGSKLKSYGIGKIVPPSGWKPPFVLDTEQFKFKTRLQRLNSMEASARANVNFMEQLYLFHKQRGSTGFINPSSKIQVPVIDHRPVDLWRLRKEINDLGGYDNITLQRKWSFLAKTMGYNVKASPAISFKLKAAYVKIIAPFDEYFNRFKQSPPKVTNNVTQRDRSPADSLSPLTSSLADHDETTRALNLMEATKEHDLKMDPSATTAPKPNKAPSTSLKMALVDPVPEEQPRAFANPIRWPPSSRPTAGLDSEMVLDQGGDVCEICGSDEDPSNILLCDSCDKGFHLQCLTPPLLAVPEGDWYCDACIVSTGNEFGFEEGREHTLASFQRRADGFKKTWLEAHPISQKQSRRQSLAKDEGLEESDDTRESSASAWAKKGLKDQLVLEDYLEKEFWRLVESQAETVEVEYGADINSAAYGSGFPNIEKQPFDPYSRDAWNLNNLPIAPGSLLRFIKSDVAGMTQPWIYVGMVFSTFAWHKEDHYTYSINYHHWGDTKTWYGVPGEDDTKLEEAIKAAAPELFEQQPDLMFQLVTLMSPGRLQRAGVRTYVCDQRPNEFVITCPRSYHSGFNHGFNLNEAVNFCLPDWLPEGYLCVKHYKSLQKMPVFSHDELLGFNEITPRLTSSELLFHSNAIHHEHRLLPHFREMVERELADRQTARGQITNLSPDIVIEPVDLPEDQVQCHRCKSFTFLSQVTSPVSPKVSCLDHSHIFGDSQKVLRYKYSDDELQAMLTRVNSRSIKAGRIVNMSGIEQRTSGRKRKPSAALLEAARAVLPLAQRIKRANTANNQKREEQPDTSGHSYAESAIANDSSLECDEDDKMETGSNISTPNHEDSEDGPTIDDKPLSSRRGFANTHRSSGPIAAPLDSYPCSPANLPPPTQNTRSVQHPKAPAFADVAPTINTKKVLASDVASSSGRTGDPSINKRSRRSRKKSEMKTAEFDGRSLQGDPSTTPSSRVSSHVHRLPLIAQIDVGGSASIVQLNSSRESLLCSRSLGSSTSLSQSQSESQTKAGKINNTGTSKASNTLRSQSSAVGKHGTNVIRLKSSSRAVSQPTGFSQSFGQMNDDNPNSYSKRDFEKLSPVALHSLPRLPFSDHDRPHQRQPSTEETLGKPSLQSLPTVSRPRGPTTSSLINILNPIAPEPSCSFDHQYSPPNQHQSAKAVHSSQHLYHNNVASSHSTHATHTHNASQSQAHSHSHSQSHASSNSDLPSQAFRMSYRAGGLSPIERQIGTGSSQRVQTVTRPPRVELSPSHSHRSSPHLQHSTPTYKSGHSANQFNPQMSPPSSYLTNRRFSSASYAGNPGDQDSASHMIISSSHQDSPPQSSH